jgi:hypothetical protein
VAAHERVARAPVAASPGSRSHGIGAREKYSARPSSPATTLTTSGPPERVGAPGHAAVPSGKRPRSRARRRRRPRRALTNGSSPWTLSTASKRWYAARAATSATRSVPDGMVRAREGDVAARRAHGVGDRSLSVATTTVLGDAEGDALPPPHDEGGRERRRGLRGGASRRAGRDDGEQAHAARAQQISRQ